MLSNHATDHNEITMNTKPILALPHGTTIDALITFISAVRTSI